MPLLPRPGETPIVLESLIDNGQSDLEAEIDRARQALSADQRVAA